VEVVRWLHAQGVAAYGPLPVDMGFIHRATFANSSEMAASAELISVSHLRVRGAVLFTLLWSSQWRMHCMDRTAAPPRASICSL